MLAAARTLGAFLILITPSLLLLECAGVVQTLHGSWRAIPQALAAGLAITGPAVLSAMSLSSLLGAILPMIVANAVTTARGVRYRVITDNPPADAHPMDPTLEDGYMVLIEEHPDQH